MDYLGLADRLILLTGVANRRSIATAVGRALQEAGARLALSVQSESHAEQARTLFPEAGVFLCDVADEAQVRGLGEQVAALNEPLAGFVHCLAFARYDKSMPAFHHVARQDFLDAVGVSCHSLLALTSALKPSLDPDASIVTLSISETTQAAENYGYMAPIKAALDSAVVFLAKSLSADSRVRVNAVGAAPLKTSASAGIPGYLNSYLYAEQATLRKQAVTTAEVANVTAFLLSPRSSGINAQKLVVDAGMSHNYFDAAFVDAYKKASLDNS